MCGVTVQLCRVTAAIHPRRQRALNILNIRDLTAAMHATSARGLPGFDLDAFVAATLAEDLGEAGDITSAAVIPEDAIFDGVMDSRDAIVVAGLPLAEAFFRALDPEVRIEHLVADGDKVLAGTDLMRLTGKARALLTAERSALNTVQHLSGIATLTRGYVDRIAGTRATLLDTRKTIPGLRLLEKYATRMGGAANHRMGLWDAAMIKDNHVAVAGSVEEAVRRAVAAGIAEIIVEVDRIDQIEPALSAGATRLLLDNMDPPTLRGAVTLVRGRVPTEASGGVRLETIRAIAETGVDFISVGRLTQSAPAADIGLDFMARLPGA
jgi:nicotinate-nucleotide pyrophosphorylase (carboxylating)